MINNLKDSENVIKINFTNCNLKLNLFSVKFKRNKYFSIKNNKIDILLYFI